MNGDTGYVITRLLRTRDILNMRLVCTVYAGCIKVPPIRFTRSKMNPEHYLSGLSPACEFTVTHDFVNFETSTALVRLKRGKFDINFYTTNYALPRCVLYNFDGTSHLYKAIRDLFPNMMAELPVFVYINKIPPKPLMAAVGGAIRVVGGADDLGTVEYEHDGVQLRDSSGAIICSAAVGIARPGYVVVMGKKTYIDDIENVRGHAISLRLATIPVLLHISDAFALYCRGDTVD